MAIQKHGGFRPPRRFRAIGRPTVIKDLHRDRAGFAA